MTIFDDNFLMTIFDDIETNFDNWKDCPGDLTFETLIINLTILTLDSICNSCDVYIPAGSCVLLKILTSPLGARRMIYPENINSEFFFGFSKWGVLKCVCVCVCVLAHIEERECELIYDARVCASSLMAP